MNCRVESLCNGVNSAALTHPEGWSIVNAGGDEHSGTYTYHMDVEGVGTVEMQLPPLVHSYAAAYEGAWIEFPEHGQAVDIKGSTPDDQPLKIDSLEVKVNVQRWKDEDGVTHQTLTGAVSVGEQQKLVINVEQRTNYWTWAERKVHITGQLGVAPKSVQPATKLPRFTTASVAFEGALAPTSIMWDHVKHSPDGWISKWDDVKQSLAGWILWLSSEKSSGLAGTSK